MMKRELQEFMLVMSKKTFCVGCKLSSLSIVSNLDRMRSICHQLEWWMTSLVIWWDPAYVEGGWFVVVGSDLVGKDSGGEVGWVVGGENWRRENRVITPSGMNIHTTHSNSTHINILMDLSRERTASKSELARSIFCSEFVKPIPITRVQVQQQCQCCDQRGHDVALV